MTSIYIDGKQYKVNCSNNLLEACLSLGLDVPYFCWHPALGSIGSCRQCAVKQYKSINDSHGNIVMSCMTPVVSETIISLIDAEVLQFRKNIIELLMINHPHDCPICVEGGNCHLQDMTVMTSHYLRRYRFDKRTYLNQYLGPFISHEMNRCITCYRCTRYYNEYAGGNDFGAYGIHNNIYFGRLSEGKLQNEFSGNLVDICPTGVFTDKTYAKYYHRKWDLQFAPSICQQCCVGCNTSPGERYGKLCKIDNRYNGSINRYFLCDLGRFSYDYVNSKDRPRQPLQFLNNNWITLNIDVAIQNVVNMLRSSRKIIGIGSSRASIESNFTLRELVGTENFYTGIPNTELDRLKMILNILRNGGIHTPSLYEIESYDAILVLGEDLTQTAARIALAIRQAVKNKAKEICKNQHIPNWHSIAIMNVGQYSKNPLFITNVTNTKLDDISTWSYYAPVDDQARLGFAIANVLDNQAPKVNDFDESLTNQINLIAKELSQAQKPLIISGSNVGSKEIIAAAANIAFALKNKGNNNVGISFIVSNSNSMGLAMIGGKSLDDALHELQKGDVDSLIILENDLYRHAPCTYIDKALNNVKHIIVLDHKKTVVQSKAHLLLSAASFAESDGTIINQEGRAQRFFKVYEPTYYDNQIVMLESWRWLHLLRVNYLKKTTCYVNIDYIINKIATKLPQLSGIMKAAPNSTFNVHGQKLARAPNRYSGRAAIHANINVHEPCTPKDEDSMFVFSMEGNNTPHAPRQHIPFAWVPGWNSMQSWNKFQSEIGGSLYFGDPGIRLLESHTRSIDYFNDIPLKFSPANNDSWLIVALWHLFGTEETSQLSENISTLIPSPYVVFSIKDAFRLDINSNTLVEMNCNGMKFCLPVKLSNILHIGQVGLPIGLPGIPTILAGLSVNNLKAKK